MAVLVHCAWVLVIAPAVLAVVSALVHDRFRPSTAAWALAWSAVVCAAAAVVTLLVAITRAVVAIPEVADWLGWPTGWPQGDKGLLAVAMLLLAWVVISAVQVSNYRQEVAQVAQSLHALLATLPWGGEEHVPLSDGATVVLALVVDPRVDVIFAARSHPKVATTTGLRELIDDTEFRALAAHEDHHVRGHHERVIALVSCAARVLPFLTRVVHQVLYLVERAADEVGAAEVRNRPLVAASIRKVIDAMANIGQLLPRPTSERDVSRRCAALLANPRTARWPAVAPALVAASSVAFTVYGVVDLIGLVPG
ncbi:hypothetical protein [Actinokineospora globicatena]|uniref:hypothetical protein n=1 Tax=Actinokineospora globicatena TaxID=103729 RepID=UPI0020A50F15|nr:hypothetical protein [Actinokineospora globicatena]MCP2303540.1 hypothetical protein [Actinokineospora globicatena]